MRSFSLPFMFVVCLSASVTSFSSAKSPNDSSSTQKFQKANAHTIDAFVVLLRLRQDLFLKWKETGKWPDDKPANAALDAHGEYWQRQLESGHALLAGGMKGDYWDNAALIIFEAKSLEEAQGIVANDPAVKAYVFQAQVRPFDISFVTNKFQMKP